MRPVLTVVTFAFHFCLLAVPLFLMAHTILFREAWGFAWPNLSDAATDAMTVIVIAGVFFFLVRRITQPEVRFVTSASDYVLLAIVAAPFITGFIAYHQFFAYRWMLIAHILSGQIMLVAIPFTRLVHMIFALLTRAYMGSEFGGIRRAIDW
jgi:nitrate reductase gamma subunit